MYRYRSIIVHFVAFILSMAPSAVSSPSAAHHLPDTTAVLSPAIRETVPAEVQVTLAASQTTRSWDNRLADRELFDLPLLILRRQRQATDPAERTLTIELVGIEAGASVELELVSWHELPSTATPHHERRRFTPPDRSCTASAPCTVTWTLDATTTLSDFYRLGVRDEDGELLWENPNPERPDLVALDTWEAALDETLVRVTYATLFSFARGEKQHQERLEPEAVHAFVAEQFMPTVIETWQTQFDEWGFGPIHPDWDADGVVEVIFTCPPFALYDGIGQFTISTYSDGRPYPERRVWLQSNQKVLERYDSLESGFKVILSHEFFHLAQWNVRLAAGQTSARWTNTIVEGQAIAASSVQYPELELSREHLASTKSQYSGCAERFLERRLKSSYVDLEAEEAHRYDTALYWRFLYEQYGDMGVFRAALEEMARRPDEESAASLHEIMDAALGRLEGPFESYEQSLIAYARANLALRLEEGRCTDEDAVACGERYHDPQRMYTIPSWEAMLDYRGSELAYDGSIPASYGTDLIEVSLDQGLQGAPLSIAFHSQGARYSVEVWPLQMDAVGPRNPMRGQTGVHAVTPRPEALSGDCSTECTYALSHLDLVQYDRLALIVVRLDADEEADPTGAYTLTVDPAP